MTVPTIAGQQKVELLIYRAYRMPVIMKTVMEGPPVQTAAE